MTRSSRGSGGAIARAEQWTLLDEFASLSAKLGLEVRELVADAQEAKRYG